MGNSSRAQESPSESWERFAIEDPYTYILTSLRNANPDEFWQTGFRTVQEELLPLVESRGMFPRTGMELGCGVGRLVFPLALHFQEIVGVDIAEAMIQRARCFARDNHVQNASFSSITGPEDLLHSVGTYERKISFLYSLLVFQHIPDWSMIEGYLHVISILLEDEGIAYLQFDTRPKSFFYHLKSNLPDSLLPRFWRKGIRRIRRSPGEIEAGIWKAGLEIIGELAPSSPYHRYILRRAPQVASRS